MTSNGIPETPLSDKNYPEEGNLPDIRRAGSLHRFLDEQHDELGKIFSFWWGSTRMVSIVSPELFQSQKDVVDIPGECYPHLLSLLGKKCLMFERGANVEKRRAIYRPVFATTVVNKRFPEIQKICEETAAAWSQVPPHTSIPAYSEMLTLSMKLFMKTCFAADISSETAKELGEHYHTLREVERIHLRNEENIVCGALSQAAEKVRNTLKELMEKRKENPPTSNDDYRLVDALVNPNNCLDEATQQSDAMFFWYMSNALGMALGFCINNLANDAPVQEELYEELDDHLKDRAMTPSNFHMLQYIKQVIFETLGLGQIVSYTARIRSEDCTLEGYDIPANTPVVNALGVALWEKHIWPFPERFNPSRFKQRLSHERDVAVPYSYKPFGFGVRECPAESLAMAEMGVALSVLCRKFEFHPETNQKVESDFALLTKPKEEILIKVTKRE